MALGNDLKGSCGRTRGDGLTLCQGRFGLAVRNDSFSRSDSALPQLPREWWGHLEVSQSRGDVALRDVGSGHGGVGLGNWRSSPTQMTLQVPFWRRYCFSKYQPTCK